jgi:hypothetical protein
MREVHGRVGSGISRCVLLQSLSSVFAGIRLLLPHNGIGGWTLGRRAGSRAPS